MHQFTAHDTKTFAELTQRGELVTPVMMDHVQLGSRRSGYVRNHHTEFHAILRFKGENVRIKLEQELETPPGANDYNHHHGVPQNKDTIKVFDTRQHVMDYLVSELGVPKKAVAALRKMKVEEMNRYLSRIAEEDGEETEEETHIRKRKSTDWVFEETAHRVGAVHVKATLGERGHGVYYVVNTIRPLKDILQQELDEIEAEVVLLSGQSVLRGSIS